MKKKSWWSHTVPPINIILEWNDETPDLVRFSVPSSAFVLGATKFDPSYWTESITRVAEMVYDYSQGEPVVDVDLVPRRLLINGEVYESLAQGTFSVVVRGKFKPDAETQVIALLGGGDDTIGIGESDSQSVESAGQAVYIGRNNDQIIDGPADEQTSSEVRGDASE